MASKLAFNLNYQIESQTANPVKEIVLILQKSSGPVAQWITRLPTEQKIAGSIPAWIVFYSFLISSRSKPFEVRNTGCKSRTLDPVWNESFAISLPNSTDFQETDEVLHLDVWNFLPDEKLREKLKRINEVKVTKYCCYQLYIIN